MANIKFELRTRKKQIPELWTINYNIDNGQIKSIEPGQLKAAGSLIVVYSKVRDLLAGKLNQNDFKVAFSDTVGALDLVNVKQHEAFKKTHVWKSWLSTSEYQGNPLSDLRVTLFNDTGIIRIEATSVWVTALRERLAIDFTDESLQLFITDEEDPHQLFGQLSVKLIDIADRGYYENRLWSIMDHDLVKDILFKGQRIRINTPPIASSMFFTRLTAYSAFNGIVDGQTVMSHSGPGKHVSLYLKDGGLWACSYYQPGSPLEQLVGNLKIAILAGDDPDNFYGWAELPVLMLKQPFAFEVLDKWPYQTTPHVLYKASNIDIGALI
jgi:hypothetical protein